MAQNPTTGPAADESLQVSVWRGGADGAYRDYQVPRRPSQTVLDVVTWIQRHLEPALAYRFACRVGMCGSCAMTVNGRPRWTCRTHVARVASGDRLQLGPLRNLPLIRDLVTDMAPFFDKWQAAGGQFQPRQGRREPVQQLPPTDLRRQAADAAIECINCAVCYAACDVVSWRPDYLGPAALNRAWAAFNDSRDAAPARILAAAAQDNGCYNCHSQQGCSEHCPVSLNPTRSIAALKRAALLPGR